MTDRAGQHLGNYHLTRLLGEGGFAEVYLGEHVHLGTQAAIKVLSAKLQSEEIERFREEARTIARLRHPAIVRVLDFGVEGGVPYLVMDYAVHGTLRHRHPKGTRLAPAVLLPYVRQVASALQFAHERKLIHRDVKPENMLVGEQGEVLLSDFGIAIAAQSSRYQSTQDVVGTLAYMAPEQIQAHPRPASDQYSLGIVVYEWLSGERPFTGSMSEVLAKQISVPPPPLREKLPALSPALEQVVLTALEKDPKARFASVQAFATAFEQACQAEAVFFAPTQAVTPPALPPTIAVSPARSPSAELSTPPALAPTRREPAPPASPLTPAPQVPPQPSGGISRREVLIGGGVGIGLAVLGGGVLLSFLNRHSSDTNSNPLYTYSGHSFVGISVAWSPDGTRIAAGSADGTVHVWDASDGSHVYIYRGHVPGAPGGNEGEGIAVAWSPDSKRIASGGGNDKTVQVWDASDGGNVYTYSGHSAGVIAVAWSPDGTRIASGSADGIMQIWDASNGSTRYTYTPPSDSLLSEFAVSSIAWSPDGTRIAFNDDSVGTVQVRDASDGSSIYAYSTNSSIAWAVAWSPDGQRIAAGRLDNTVDVWNANDGGNTFTHHGHSNSGGSDIGEGVQALAWSPDSRRIASGSADGTVQVWDVSDVSNVYTYSFGPETVIHSIAWSPDGKRIAFVPSDTTVQVWKAP